MATAGRSIITSKGSSQTPLAEGCLAQLTRPPWDSSFSPLRQEWPPASTFHKSAHFTQLSLKATEEPGHESMKTLENFKEDTAQIWVQNLFVCFFLREYWIEYLLLNIWDKAWLLNYPQVRLRKTYEIFILNHPKFFSTCKEICFLMKWRPIGNKQWLDIISCLQCSMATTRFCRSA